MGYDVTFINSTPTILKGEVAGRLSPELGLLLDGTPPYYSKGPETRGRRLIL